MNSNESHEAKGRNSDETDYKVKRSEKKSVSWKNQFPFLFLLIIIVCFTIIFFQAQELTLSKGKLEMLQKQERISLETIESLNQKLRDCQQSQTNPKS